MTVVNSLASRAPAGAVVCPVPVRWRQVGRAVRLSRGFRARRPLSTVSCHGLVGGGRARRWKGGGQAIPIAEGKTTRAHVGARTVRPTRG
jgi:hypothetical protein